MSKAYLTAKNKSRRSIQEEPQILTNSLNEVEEMKRIWVIAENKEEAEWVTGGKQVTKNSLNFIAKARWTLVRHRLAPTINDNTSSADREALVACLMYLYPINIPRIIADEIRDQAVGVSTTIPFPSIVFRLCMEEEVPRGDGHLIGGQRIAYIGLIRDEMNPVSRSRIPKEIPAAQPAGYAQVNVPITQEQSETLAIDAGHSESAPRTSAAPLPSL
ncbi:hypothetical protein HAX54_030101 [Datura stramonium]|uniref:Putative plant transposon protein domain-containing protein n=1 Tax=Datura stramonium TaxID=4076 RepID=A0ABS8V754_DATST|nr:hypothetical protein [Datura stramonium]